MSVVGKCSGLPHSITRFFLIVFGRLTRVSPSTPLSSLADVVRRSGRASFFFWEKLASKASTLSQSA